MPAYARVEDGKVVEGPREVPTAYKNVSGFHFLSDEDKAAFGWFPVREVKPALASGEEYESHTVKPGQDEVVLTFTKKPTKTLDVVKTEARDLLKASYESFVVGSVPDTDRILAMVGRLPDARKTELQEEVDRIRTKRQEHLDAIAAAATIDAVPTSFSFSV
jgi:hypothetical protein